MLLELAKKPTDLKALVKALLSKKQGETKNFHSLIEVRRNNYFLNHYEGKGKKKAGEERVYLADEQRLVDAARNLMMREVPRIHAYSEADTAPEQKDSDKLEAWLRGLMYLQARRQRVDPVSLFTLGMLRDGVGVLQVYWDTGLDSRFDGQTGEMVEGQGLTEPPIVIRNRDPLTVFAQEGAAVGRWRWIMVAEELPLLDIEEEWGGELRRRGGEFKETKGKSYEEKLESRKVIDVWSREVDPETGAAVIVNMVMTEETILKEPTVMDKYKDLPFDIRFCVPTAEKSWVRKGLPITAAIERLVPELEGLLNSEMRRAKLSAQLPWLYGGYGNKPPKLVKGFGKGLQKNENQTLEFMQLPGPPPDLMVMIRQLATEVQAGGMGSPVTGTPPASPSGYALDIRGQAGTLKMVEPANSLQWALVNVFQTVCSLAAAFAPDEPMKVLGRLKDQSTDEVLALTGSECEGFIIDVKVAARFPEDKARDRAIGMQLMQSPVPILDTRTILEEYMDHQNVDQIKKRLLVEMAEQQPAVQQVVLGIALQQAGLQEWIPMVMGGQQGGQGSPPAVPTSMPVEGVPTDVASQESLGAARSQEMGMAPGGQLPGEVTTG